MTLAHDAKAGRRSRQWFAASNCAARAIIVASPAGRPINYTPTGKLFASNPVGIATAGCPLALNGGQGATQ